MGRELGRISGPLLANNLLRNGNNLVFDNQVLYLDVNNKRIGANTNAPVSDLYTPNAIDTVILNVDTTANIANFTVGTNIIQNAVSSITISPNQSSTPTIIVPGLSTSNLVISGDTINNTVSNDNINIVASGTGQINFNSNTLINGNLHATGNVTWDGNITFGNASTDTLSFGAEINSGVIPATTNTYNLGSSSLTWGTVYSHSLATTSTITLTGNASTGSITGSGTNNLNGNVTIGTTSSNTLGISSGLTSNIVPGTTNTYNLGSSSYYWNVLDVKSITDGNLTFTSNTVTANTTNSNLSLNANGTGNVVFSSLNLTNNASTGSLNVTGTTTFSNNVSTGAITQTGNLNQTSGNTSITGTFGATGNITGQAELILPQVTINNNSIAGTASNTNLSITANGTGAVTFPSNNVSMTDNLSVSGTIGVTGTSTFTNVTTGNITQTGNFTQTGSSNANITGNVTATTNLVLNGGSSSFTIGSVTGSNQTITNANANSNVQFQANGTGNVWLGSTLEVNTNNIFNASGNVQFTPNGTGNVKIVSSSALVLPIGDNTTRVLGTLGEIRYNDISNNIEADGVANASLTVTSVAISTSGDGYAVGDVLTVSSASGTATFTVTSITITNPYVTPKTGNVTGVSITTAGSFVAPIILGAQTTTSTPSSGRAGCTLSLQYTNEYVNFLNVYSSDRQTYITGELTPGAADNTLRFAVGGTVTTTISSTTLFNNTMYSGNISISGNQISNLISTNDININPSGTGKINVNGTDFDVVSGNYITNSSNSAFILASTGNGYYKFDGTNGLVFPVGTNSNHPVSPETGATRFNTDLAYGEVFNGTTWQPIGGTSAVLSQSQVNDVMWAWDLILG